MLPFESREHVHFSHLHPSIDEADPVLKLKQLLVCHDFGVHVPAKQMHSLLGDFKLIDSVVYVLGLHC